MRAHRRTMIVLGLAASAVFVYLAVRGLALGAVRQAFIHAELWPWLPIGIGTYLLSHVMRGVRCQLLVRRHARLRLGTAINIVVVGYGANNVLPARLGELVRAGMLAERTHMPIAQSLGVTFIERVLDGLVMLLFLVLASLTVHVAGWMRDLVHVAVVVFGGATVVMIVGALWPELVLGLTSRLTRPLGARWHPRLLALARHVTDAGACLRSPRDAALLITTSLGVWALEACIYVCVLPIFHLEPNPAYAVITMCVTGFGLLMPSSPGGIGPYHYFASQTLMVHGVAAPTALAYATLVHLAWFVPITLWAAAAMLWYGVELSSTAALARTGDAGVVSAAKSED